MRNSTVLASIGIAALLGGFFIVPAQAQNVNTSEVKAKTIKLKGSANQLRHAKKTGWINITAKTKVKKVLRATKAIDARKHIINKKGAVKVKDNLVVTGKLTVNGLINGVDLSALNTTVTGLSTDVSTLQSDVTALQSSSVYTAGSGLALSNNAFSLATDCSTNELLKWDGDSWECDTDDNNGSGSTYTAGTGISISGGNVISSTVTDTDTTYSASTGISINGSNEISATLGAAIDTSEITNGTILGADISDGTIASADIADGTIATADIDDDAITAAKILNGTIDTDDLATSAVTSIKIEDGTISSDDIASSTILSGDIFDGTIAAADLGADSVGASELSSSAIQSGDIELGDLPSIASSNLSDASSIALLGDAETITGNWVNTANPWSDNEVATDLTIDGGRIDDSPIGRTTASTGNFTNLTIRDESPLLRARPQVPRLAVNETIATLDGSGDEPAPAIVTAGNGEVLVAYYDDAGGDLELVNCGLSASFCSAETTATVDSTDDVGQQPAMVLGTNGYPIIAYYDVTNSALEIAFCDDNDCGSPTIRTVDSADDVGKGASIAIGGDGFPVIAYVDDTNNNVVVAKCDSATDCSSPTITDIGSATASTSTFATGIAINPFDGFPVIAHIEFDDDLGFIDCDTASCSTNTPASAEASITVNDLSLTIDHTGLPLIAYMEGTNISVAQCATDACGSPTITDVVAADGFTYIAHAIGADGFPLIAYEQTGAGSFLQIVRCDTYGCATTNSVNRINKTISGTDKVNNVSIGIASDGTPVAAYYNDDNDRVDIYKAPNQLLTEGLTLP